MFKNNKYTKTYNDIIENARERTGDDGIFEHHHIIPRSLGGADDNDNLVFLTPREHYLCHALLPKMVTGNAVYKMYAAFNMMHVDHSGKRYTSRLYEYYKIKFYKEHSKHMIGRKRTVESKLNQSKATKGVPWSENARKVKRLKPTAKTVLVYKKADGQFIGEWESIALCAKELSCDTTTVWRICEGTPCSKSSSGKKYPLKSHKGYTFKYKTIATEQYK